MKTYLKYGGAMAGGGFLITLVLFMVGLHSDPAKLTSAQWIQGCLGLAVGIGCVVLGTKELRAATPVTEEFGYGKALGAGVMITLFSALIGLVTNALYMQVINPGMTDIIMQGTIAKWEAAGISSSQIEKMESAMRTMMSPPIMAVSSFLSGMFFGTIISLITAAFLKRAAIEDLSAAS